ncbi:MAG: OsmC family protein [Gaiellaceae bacterium]
MAVAKEFSFPVTVHSGEGPRVTATSAGKPPLGVATPPEFGSGIEGVWSPEELLVGAVAACFELTFKAVARRRDLPIERLELRANGRVGNVPNQGLGFLAVELDVDVETEAEHRVAVEAAAQRAHEHCIVGQALAVPVELTLHVGARRRGLSRVA